ncbi:hypothetical protein SB748_27160 [Rhizobium sp. SIMBA_035]
MLIAVPAETGMVGAMTGGQILTYMAVMLGISAAAYLLYETFSAYSLLEVVGSVREIPARNLAMAIL